MIAWPTVPLGELCQIELGGTPPRGSPRFWDEGRTTGNVWLSIADLPMTVNAIVSDSKEYLSDEGAARGKIVKTGTLLVSFKLTLGRLAFAGCDLRTNEAIGALSIREAKRVSNEYLYWFLTYFDWDKAAEGEDKIKGKTLNKAKLKELPVLLPPLEEQRRIVAMLDEAFAAIATATANGEKNLANARELFDDFLSATFDGTTNDWDVFTIGEVCTLRSGTTVRAELEQPSGEVPYLKVADMSHPDNLEMVTTSSRFLRRSDVGRNALIPAGATIFPKRGGAIMTNKKRLVATPMAADLNIMSVIPGPRLAARFLNYYFQNVDMRFLGSGSSIPQINNYDIEPLKIAIPDEATQLDFVAKADAVKSEITKLAAIYSRKLVQLSQLKQSLLHCAFTGELTSALPETVAA